MSFHSPERFRARKLLPHMNSREVSGDNGIFMLPPMGLSNLELRIVAGNGYGWEHVSVSTSKRPPSWAEMCHVKELFWDPEDCVMQLHPPRSEWVNNHPYCLHLWRPVGVDIPRPPSFMVGIKGVELGAPR